MFSSNTVMILAALPKIRLDGRNNVDLNAVSHCLLANSTHLLCTEEEEEVEEVAEEEEVEGSTAYTNICSHGSNK